MPHAKPLFLYSRNFPMRSGQLIQSMISTRARGTDRGDGENRGDHEGMLTSPTDHGGGISMLEFWEGDLADAPNNS